MWYKYILLLLLCGCSVQLQYKSGSKIPNTKQELIIYLEDKRAELDGLKLELEEAKTSRDAILEASKSADGYFAQSEYARLLSNSNRDISFINDEIKWIMSDIAIAQEKINSIKENENE